MLYLICFPQEGEEKSYRAFLDRLDALGPNRMAFPGCYLLDAPHTAQGVACQLRPLLPRAGRLLVSRLSGRGEESAGRLSPGAKAWILRRGRGEKPAPTGENS